MTNCIPITGASVAGGTVAYRPVALASTSPSSTGLSPLLALEGAVVVLGASVIVERRNVPDPSHPAVRRWYSRLEKPGYTPPDAAFEAVWPMLETRFAVGGYWLLRQPSGTARNAAVGLWQLGTVMVGGWTQLFFIERRLGARRGGIGRNVRHQCRLRRNRRHADLPAAAAAVPFVAWLGFATLLAERI